MTGIQITQTTSQQFIDEITTPILELLKQVKEQLQPKEPEDYLGREATAQLLKINVSTLHNWTKQGRLIAYGIGGKILYKRSEIEKALIRLK